MDDSGSSVAMYASGDTISPSLVVRMVRRGNDAGTPFSRVSVTARRRRSGPHLLEVQDDLHDVSLTPGWSKIMLHARIRAG